MDYFELMEKLDRIERLLVSNKEVLTLEETCEYTGISRSYLYKLTAAREIPHSKPNGKMIFFEKKKLNEWLLQNGRKSKMEIEDAAIKYTLKRRNGQL
ncbi:helix-turn-helix domain-containing protein [Muricauda sp. CAU 1633]|uniref:helix-turn-helix transcriptional regulator n=1 Tax=Allomuricauda sp. CAU 1633 TaxID=2816036 RepID=UPI001A901E6F|nr:helix-turn-helix domain-containing protein [Muricauda sp. CAU 1633]MBO0323851.1 helix-turn-helix domain-containing protein [Muricauda sp. CAU 1633]